ncbi:MAG: hypothetical protein MJ231_07225 [bacterium]|nr:hypothetical protein [bacterium]
MEIFRNFIYFILSVQEKFLAKKLEKTIGIKNKQKHKKIYSQGCFVKLESIAESERIKMEEELELILKSSDYNPNNVLKYVETHNTSVYYISSKYLLNKLGEDDGFIYPQTGIKALLLSVLIKKAPALKLPEMFVLLKDKQINNYNFIYHFYNWYAYEHGIFGIDNEAQKLLKTFLETDADVEKLQLSEIYKLQNAITQDKAAIEFVIKLCKKYDASQKALDKIKDGGANI